MHWRKAWGSGPHATMFQSCVPCPLKMRTGPRPAPGRGAGTDAVEGDSASITVFELSPEVNMPSSNLISEVIAHCHNEAQRTWGRAGTPWCHQIT